MNVCIYIYRCIGNYWHALAVLLRLGGIGMCCLRIAFTTWAWPPACRLQQRARAADATDGMQRQHASTPCNTAEPPRSTPHRIGQRQFVRLKEGLHPGTRRRQQTPPQLPWLHGGCASQPTSLTPQVFDAFLTRTRALQAPKNHEGNFQETNRDQRQLSPAKVSHHK